MCESVCGGCDDGGVGVCGGVMIEGWECVGMCLMMDWWECVCEGGCVMMEGWVSK